MMTEEEDKRERLSVWYLLWIIPLSVAIIFTLLEMIQQFILIDDNAVASGLIDIIQVVITAVVVSIIAIYMVVTHRQKREWELQKALSDLREVDKSKNYFLSNVSHELKTPLTTINGYIKFMLSEKAGTLSEKQQKYLTIMSEESDRLQHYIDELIFITTMENRPMQLNPEVVNLSSLGSSIIESMRIKASLKGIALDISLKEDLKMRADKTRLHQLISNLIHNSIKYTQKDGKILLRIRQKGKDINIQVIDSGIGIPKDKHELVFQRFYQVDGSSSRSASGTGLGLAICKQIVKTSQGTIKIVSPLPGDKVELLGLEPDDRVTGTMFEVDLPRKVRRINK